MQVQIGDAQALEPLAQALENPSATIRPRAAAADQSGDDRSKE